ncbi:DUF1993 domain-containing protein [Rhizobium sp. S152]|uniref:DUF1993 domain-containing protein n=1 Tax=Rhizobium sp. S152 TaxID=3055038 RepID=UPI0025A9F92D|nr:DUF1993 domain-containing protein [Rhizobium sp. S152]MDM9628518.1 DUF1993 domain-containing protein [Rhizobium sp. S152]
MYDLTIPALTRGLSVLYEYVSAAGAHADETAQGEDALVKARLAPDMLPFAGQVQRASDNSKNGVSRLTGLAAPSFADTETTFVELHDRIAKTVAFLEGVPQASFEDAAEREVELRFASVTGKMNGQSYLTKFLLPNFYFHIATAHGILRNQGLAIGKRDYLGPLD